MKNTCNKFWTQKAGSRFQKIQPWIAFSSEKRLHFLSCLWGNCPPPAEGRVCPPAPNTKSITQFSRKVYNIFWTVSNFSGQQGKENAERPKAALHFWGCVGAKRPCLPIQESGLNDLSPAVDRVWLTAGLILQRLFWFVACYQWRLPRCFHPYAQSAT